MSLLLETAAHGASNAPLIAGASALAILLAGLAIVLLFGSARPHS